jgi:para-aminobenzoate synthetase/4-amino-4-deoxychorismate lyase
VATRHIDTDAIDVLRMLPHVNADHDGAIVGGGWFGWLSYDGPSYLAFYDHLLRSDRNGRWRFEALWTPERAAALDLRQRELTGLLASPARSAGLSGARGTVGTFHGLDMTRHLSAVEDAIELIRAGEIFQVNVCSRLYASFDGSPAELFAKAAEALRPAFGAFVDAGDRALAGFSPELFVRRRGREVLTSPIKGTWPAGDADAAAALANSTKDAAENVMIVDLMRNDFGRVCDVGSVRATALLKLEKHPGVWHLVSTVAGALRPGVDDADLLHATFPPGSVTGAPKQQAMEAIAALEGQPRGAYTGIVGFASPGWGAEWSVTIRSFEIADGCIELGVGGGVTADSVPMLEWRECLHKAAPLLSAVGASLAEEGAADAATPTAEQLSGGLLETLACRGGQPLRLADHLGRLDRSGRELYRRGLPSDLAARVAAAARGTGPGLAVVHLRLDPDGNIALTVSQGQPVRTATPTRTVVRRGGIWRHRWADVRCPDVGRPDLGRPDVPATEVAIDRSEPLFVAPDGTVLETASGNVFLLLADGTLVTPPLRDDLVPGVTRRTLLDHARDSQRPVELREFDLAEMTSNVAFWTNSVSGAVPISKVDDVPLHRNDKQIAAFRRHLIGIPVESAER